MQCAPQSNVAFDLDGVFVDYFCHFANFIKSNYQNEVVIHNRYELITINKMRDHELFKAMDEVGYDYKNTPIMDGAAELVESLYDLTKEPILIITARPAHLAAHTHQLVKRFCRVPFMIGFSNGKSKLDFMSGRQFIVEDRRKTAIELAKAGKQVFLIDTHYNQVEFNGLGSKIVRINGVKDLVPIVRLFVK